MTLIARTSDDIDAEFDIVNAIGALIDPIVDSLRSTGAITKTLRKWLTGHVYLPEDEAAQRCLMAMAADLDMFTPSTSGQTLVDRRLRALTPQTLQDQQAVRALRAAQFHLVSIVDREGPDLVRLKDLVSGESLLLLDARISSQAVGLPTAMRLCPLESGRYALVSPLFVMDQAMLAEAMTFVRHGRPLGTGHRCAASLYRNVARRGFQPMPQLITKLDEGTFFQFLRELEEHLSPIHILAAQWIAAEDEDPELVAEARALASVGNLVEALGSYAQSDDLVAPEGFRTAFEQIAALQVETIAGRARAGVHGAAQMLDQAAADVADHIAQGTMHAEAGALLARLRQRAGWSGARKPTDNAAAASAEIDRVIQRIQALRARTADRGCTEAEAMAAAAKVSELLARHDLTLDEVSVRQSDCEGISVATGRKRRAPVDTCTTSIATFCDCRVWCEQRGDDGLGYVYFGLKTDVEAARFLHDLIEATFATESETFRQNTIYQTLRGGDRRTALNSFQVGLASGICQKLDDLKTARQASTAPDGMRPATGVDLVAVKHAMLDDEIDRLGLHFTTRAATTRRHVHRASFHAGKIAGAQFEPAVALGG